MARTPRTFARRSHAEAKARENTGQGKPREDVTEKAKQTDQQKQMFGGLLHYSEPSDFFYVWLRLGGVDQASVSTGLCRVKAHPKLWSINSPRIVSEPY
jgi:hypothetical protein